MKPRNLGISRAAHALAAFALAGAVSAAALSMAARAAEDDAFVCMEESQEKCDYENKNMELFIKARDAFDRGREAGDLKEARDTAMELIQRGDAKHGKGLMIYILLQLGQGTHKNLVEAYRWVAADIAAGVTYPRIKLERTLEQIAARMTPEQLAEAKK